MDERDFDWLVVGSGFGGSVAALRLAEKGYRVGVVECGRRYEDEDFAESAWQMRRYFWMPKLGMRGIFRLTVFKDVFICSGNGVGGGSLGYANTLYRAQPAFFANRQWEGLAEWDRELAPHYETAERMLGVAEYEGMTEADRLLKAYGEEIGVGETYKQTRVGIFFGPAGEEVDDPYFGGEGPARTGCVRCAQCMLGCRYGAKNTLVKNYLWFAEKLGVEVLAERQVTDIRPIGPADGSEGYELETVHPGAWLRKRRRKLTARGVVVAAGALGTNQLLANCKHAGGLPRISDRLGELVRTNSESIQAITAAPGDERDFTKSVAITSSIYPDPDTHIEVVGYGAGGDAISRLFTIDDRRRDAADAAAEVDRGDAPPPAEDRCGCSGGRSAGRSGRSSCWSCSRSTRRCGCGRSGGCFGRGVRLQTEQDPTSARTRPSSPRPRRRRPGSPSRWAASRRAGSPSRRSTSRPPPTSSAAP